MKLDKKILCHRGKEVIADIENMTLESSAWLWVMGGAFLGLLASSIQRKQKKEEKKCQS